MTDIPMADTGPDRRAGGRANGFGIVIVTIVLTVVGTNVAVGAFLWLALDARMTNLEAGMSQLRTELKADIRELRDEARATNTRLSRIEGVLGITGPAAPDAAAQ